MDRWLVGIISEFFPPIPFISTTKSSLDGCVSTVINNRDYHQPKTALRQYARVGLSVPPCNFPRQPSLASSLFSLLLSPPTTWYSSLLPLTSTRPFLPIRPLLPVPILSLPFPLHPFPSPIRRRPPQPRRYVLCHYYHHYYRRAQQRLRHPSTVLIVFDSHSIRDTPC